MLYAFFLQSVWKPVVDLFMPFVYFWGDMNIAEPPPPKAVAFYVG